MDKRKGYRLRWADQTDYADLAEVMFDAVRNGRSAYSQAQRKAWVPEHRSGSEWSERLHEQLVLIGESDSEVVGFMSLGQGGYIDLAFIRPRFQGTGLFGQLFTKIKEQSFKRGDVKLWVHASIMAEPAFRAAGFSIVERQTVAIGIEQFKRFKMELDFATSAFHSSDKTSAFEPSDKSS